MDLRNNLISPIATLNPRDQRIDVDLTGFIRRLLLFDTFILQSIRLRELPSIVAAMGYEQTAELFSSKAVRIHCDALTIGQIGQLESIEARREKGLLPLGSYSFAAVKIPDERRSTQPLDNVAGTSAVPVRDHEEYIHSCLKELNANTSLPLKHVVKLKQRIVDAMVSYPTDRGQATVRQLQEDLRVSSPMIGILLQKSVGEQHGISMASGQLSVHVTHLDETDFRVETNLADFLLDPLAIHRVIERALLALGGLYQRIEEMKTYNAISGCIDSECPLFTQKLGFLLERCRPGAEEARFQRVLEIRGLPEFLPVVDKLDVSKLLAVRESAEIREFRHWLSTVDTATDDEIGERVGGLAAKVGSVVQSIPGKALRFVATTGLGLIGPVVGGAAGVIDTFLVEKVLPKSGVWTFINKLYPSIFASRP